MQEEDTQDHDRVQWNCEAQFDSEGELLAYLNANGSWSKRGTDKTTGKIRWRCNLVKTTGPQCNAKKYSIPKFELDEEVIHLYTTPDAHNHQELANLKEGFN